MMAFFVAAVVLLFLLLLGVVGVVAKGGAGSGDGSNVQVAALRLPQFHSLLLLLVCCVSSCFPRIS